LGPLAAGGAVTGKQSGLMDLMDLIGLLSR